MTIMDMPLPRIRISADSPYRWLPGDRTLLDTRTGEIVDRALRPLI
jgi:hypothetical protein